MKKLILLLSLVSIITSCGKSQNSSESAVEIKKAALVADTTKLWENGKILNVVFLDGSQEMQESVAKYAKEWSLYANIDFKFYTKDNFPKSLKPDIRVTFKAKGNNSSVGTDSKRDFWAHSMSLSALSNENFINRYYIIHEFGHAIGLEHEHQNINRSFELDEDNAYAYCKKVFSMNKTDCRNFIFEVKRGKAIYSSKYDPKSIMHYSLHEDMLKEKMDLSTSYNLSLLDKLEIAKLYPGRVDAVTIIAEHKSHESDAESTMIYNNCKITESINSRIRLNADLKPQMMKVKFYTYESIIAGDFAKNVSYEDKEIAVREMIENSYCNLNTIELKDFRATFASVRLSDNKFGNCEIPLSEQGTPLVERCTEKAPFQISKKGKKELAVDSCFYSFDAAKEQMKKAPYCNLSAEQVATSDKQEADKLKGELKFGKCIVMNKKDVINPKKKLCPDVTPWFVTNETKTNLLGMCTETPESSIRDMKKAKECQL